MISLFSKCLPKWKNSDEEKVHLEKIDFEAAGRYYCEVSTDTPIFTKESNVEQVYVIGKYESSNEIKFYFIRIKAKAVAFHQNLYFINANFIQFHAGIQSNLEMFINSFIHAQFNKQAHRKLHLANANLPLAKI